MSNFKIAALVASLTMAIPVFAQTDQTTQTTTTTTVQTTAPSAVTQDTARANRMAYEMLNDPNVHWTIKEQTALLVEAPYVRPSDIWELNHMFRTMPANDQRVIFDALTNTIRENAGDYYTRRAAQMAYYQNLYSGTTVVTTTTTTTPPAITTPSTAYTPSAYGDSTNIRQQSMVGAGMALDTGMSDFRAWEMLQKNLDAGDRTTFRMLWNNMTSGQQDAMIDIAKQSHRYFTVRSAGVYYNPY